jgi:hypothetical protein
MQTTMMSSSSSGGAGSDMIRMIQSQLSALGFRVPVTGVLGPATRRAIRLFQRSIGLPANGSLDRRTVQALRARASGGAQPAPQAAPFVDDGISDAAPPDTAPPDAEPADAAAPADAPDTAPAAEPEPADAQGEVSQNIAGKPACQCFGKCTHLEVDRVPLLAAHRGKGGPDLVIVWNDLGTKPQAVDVVVHLHGHAKCRPGQNPRRLNLCRDIQPFSGLDFSDPAGRNPPSNDPRTGRQRPTILLLPRGNNTGTDGGTGYDFPALRAAGGLQKLIDFALAQVQQKLGVDNLRTKRLILTAHSGGGHDLQEILRYADPHEVQIFDGLYNLAQNPRTPKTPYVLTAWAAKRIARDLSAVASGRPLDQYMAAAGGALRVISLGTWRLSSIVNQALGKLLPAGSPLAKWYRVEKTRESHCSIPRRFGWQLLAGSGADVKGLMAATATSNELELEDAPAGHTITSPGFRPGTSNCSATERRIKRIVEPAKTDVTVIALKYRHDRHKKILLERKTYQAYAKLKAAAEADGLPANALTIVSGYRSISHQKVLFQRAVEKYGSEKAATKWVAPPGHSAHHTGRAIDFYVGGSNSSTNAAKQRTLVPYKWLVCNALKFGFTPYAAEPWHWEFHPA